jgi:hypothetical protein
VRVNTNSDSRELHCGQTRPNNKRLSLHESEGLLAISSNPIATQRTSVAVHFVTPHESEGLLAISSNPIATQTTSVCPGRLHTARAQQHMLDEARDVCLQVPFTCLSWSRREVQEVYCGKYPKRGLRCLPHQQHMWDEGRQLSFCQPHPLPWQHSIHTLEPQIKQNACRGPHPACAAGVSQACTRAQFHGEPRVNLVAQHPIPQSTRPPWGPAKKLRNQSVCLPGDCRADSVGTVVEIHRNGAKE